MLLSNTGIPWALMLSKSSPVYKHSAHDKSHLLYSHWRGQSHSEKQLTMEDDVARFKEYGKIYENVKSEQVKSELLNSAPAQVLAAYAVVAKNVLIENISLTPEEFDFFQDYKETLKELGLQKRSAKRRRELLADGNLFQALSNVMSKLSTPRTAYQMRN